MADQLPPQPEEREQGAVQEQEIQAQMNPVEPQALALPQAAPAPVAQGAQQPQAEQRASTPWIIPHSYDNVRGRAKNRAERMYNVGMLWEVLAKSSTDPAIRGIAEAMRMRRT